MAIARKREGVLFELEQILEVLFAYRIPVYVLTFLLIVAPFRYQYALVHPEIIFLAISFSSLMAFIYLLNKVTDTVEDAINVKGGPIARAARLRTFLLALACLLFPLPYLFVFDPRLLLTYGVVALLGFYYSHELPFIQNSFRLKQVLVVKNAIIGLLFALPPVAVQVAVLAERVSSQSVTDIVALFCVFFTFGMLRDVRDVEGDLVADIRTIPNTFGLRTTQIVGTALLGVYSLLVLPLHFSLFSTLGVVVALGFVWGSSQHRGVWFYYANLLAGIVFLFLLGFRA